MAFRLERGGISSLETAYGLLEDYGKGELKDRLHLELLLSKDDYHAFFATDDSGSLIGCALLYKTDDYIWLDFMVIREKYQRRGYGLQMMNLISEMSDNLDLGLFVELQTPEGCDYEEEMVPVRLVEKAGCVKLDIPYRLASEFVETNAQLYFKPSEHVRNLTGRTIERVLEHALTEIHSDVFTIEDTIDYLKEVIENGRVYYSKPSKGWSLASIFGG